jgi:hypothetical protein
VLSANAGTAKVPASAREARMASGRNLMRIMANSPGLSRIYFGGVGSIARRTTIELYERNSMGDP